MKLLLSVCSTVLQLSHSERTSLREDRGLIYHITLRGPRMVNHGLTECTATAFYCILTSSNYRGQSSHRIVASPVFCHLIAQCSHASVKFSRIQPYTVICLCVSTKQNWRWKTEINNGFWYSISFSFIIVVCNTPRRASNVTFRLGDTVSIHIRWSAISYSRKHLKLSEDCHSEFTLKILFSIIISILSKM